MIRSSVHIFQDPYELESLWQGSNMKLLVTTSGRYESNLTKITMPRVWMQRTESALSQLMHQNNDNDRCSIGFVADSQDTPLYHNGREILRDMIIVVPGTCDHHARVVTPSRLATMSLSPVALATASYALNGRELAASPTIRHLRVTEHLISRLRSLHEATCHLAANTPDILAQPEVAKAVEDELIRAMVGCLDQAETPERKYRSHLRMPVMQRFERVVGEADDQPLYLTEICAKVGVEERTLRNHCIEYLGMSPHRYLWLRRMKQVRRALSLADPAGKTVTAIASDYGFWELGRFSVAYRKLFGEAPSVTLRNSREPAQVASSFSAPASRFPDPLR